MVKRYGSENDAAALYEQAINLLPDEKKALPVFEKSAEMGCSEAVLMCGSMYLYGRGVDKNLRKALCWYDKVSDVPEAQVRLGEIWEQLGEIEQAKDWYERAVRYAIENKIPAREYLDACDALIRLSDTEEERIDLQNKKQILETEKQKIFR